MRVCIYIITLMTLAVACMKEKQTESHRKENVETLYTCSMHPQIIHNTPGLCPICGMELVPIGSSHNGLIKLTDAQAKLANITTLKISGGSSAKTTVVNAVLTFNQDRSQVISSRAEGRIEKLFVKQTGVVLKKGMPLYILYSETLLALEKEYLVAKDQAENIQDKKFTKYADAARQKLLLYGMTETQIAHLSENKNPEDHVTFFAPGDGLVTEISVEEGQYVEEGATLFRLEDTRSIWVEAELYPHDVPLVNTGDEISVMSESNGDMINAHVSFVAPAYKENTQLVIMRAVINNEMHTLKPGMQVKVILKSLPHANIIVPSHAVIHDAQGAYVYVEAEHNIFFPKIVTTGNEDVDDVEIVEGLNEGDVIASTGAYLLHSESILKAPIQNKTVN
jgi:Cu(I)/Ag(I) efflux system membrane fusion protein